MTTKAKKSTPPKAKKCAVCFRTSETLKKFEDHHTDYENDITICLCYQCHCWCHGKTAVGMKWHPLKREFGDDMGCLAFAERYIKAHKESLR